MANFDPKTAKCEISVDNTLWLIEVINRNNKIKKYLK